MIFKETKIKGVYIIDIEPILDERGFFARSCCVEEFKKHGIDFNIVQCNISFNSKRGTLRGMHYQKSPYEEDKLISCIKGSIYDVALDIRGNSETKNQWISIELNENNRRMIYIPKGCAHGFQTLEDNTEIFYQMSQYYNKQASVGIRYDDPIYKIKWPIEKRIISYNDEYR